MLPKNKKWKIKVMKFLTMNVFLILSTFSQMDSKSWITPITSKFLSNKKIFKKRPEDYNSNFILQSPKDEKTDLGWDLSTLLTYVQSFNHIFFPTKKIIRTHYPFCRVYYGHLCAHCLLISSSNHLLSSHVSMKILLYLNPNFIF